MTMAFRLKREFRYLYRDLILDLLFCRIDHRFTRKHVVELRRGRRIDLAKLVIDLLRFLRVAAGVVGFSKVEEADDAVLIEIDDTFEGRDRILQITEPAIAHPELIRRDRPIFADAKYILKYVNGKLELKAGGRLKKIIQIFANPNMPQIDDYYEPFTYDHARLQNAPLSEAAPTARPISLITGEKMDKITWGPNWEDDLAGEFHKRAKDQNFSNMEKEIYKSFENTFHLYLPRICNHCINPACVASCPSGALYKREEDGIVLADQDRCRGWRMCISGCPYKKVFFNWESSKAEKCIGCYPRVESGLPTVCSESCVGRIRYNGIILYDADKLLDAASTDNEQDLYKAHLNLFVDPYDPAIIEQAKKDGVPDHWIEAAQKSPIYKMAVDWKIAFPLHPEFRTPEWREVRVDLDEAAAPDLLASMTDLSPVPSGSVHAIYCHHSLEHLPAHEVPRALAEFTRVLRPRGIALLCTPDLQRIGELLVAERLHEAAYVSPAGPISALDMVYGHGASIAAGQALMAHRTGFTGNTLGQALLAAGFADVEVNRVGFDLWVLASMTAPAA
mgnify:CR=1 FL=1